MRGWRQAELARRAGIGQPNIQRIEKNQTRNPRGDTLGEIAQALGVEVDVLLGRSPIPLVLPPLSDAAPATDPTLAARVDALTRQNAEGFSRLSEQLERLTAVVSRLREESPGLAAPKSTSAAPRQEGGRRGRG